MTSVQVLTSGRIAELRGLGQRRPSQAPHRLRQATRAVREAGLLRPYRVACGNFGTTRLVEIRAVA